MLVLDFINVGNGDSALIRQMEGGEQRFAMLVDCGDEPAVSGEPPALETRALSALRRRLLKKNGC